MEQKQMVATMAPPTAKPTTTLMLLVALDSVAAWA